MLVETTRAPGAASNRVLIVAPVPPPYGGMALQALQLERRLRGDGIPVTLLASNFVLPRLLRFAEHVPILRTLLRLLLIWPTIWRHAGRADVVHLFAASWSYFFLVVCPVVLVSRLRGKRVVLNYRGGDADRFFATHGWVAGPVLRLASVITAPSAFLVEIIQRRFGLSVAIVPNILDTSAFAFRTRPVLRPNLLVTRHLEPAYDTETVLRAFREVVRHCPEARLGIAGTGTQEVYLRSLVTEWDLDGSVEFLGGVEHRNLPGVYDRYDIYLNGSRVDNFPGALLEASAAGLVIVSTGAGGIPFLYEHGNTAMLANPGDWQSLAASVLNVLKNPYLAERMASAALSVVQSCAWPEVRKSLSTTYGFPLSADTGGNENTLAEPAARRESTGSRP